MKKLEKLEAKRDAIHGQLVNLGDFKRGTISVNYRKCGKKNCACTKPGHPGHGPQYLWNTTIKGKSYAKNLKLGPELKKTLEETDNYKVFLKLCEELVKTNEKICQLRDIPEITEESEADALKKKLRSLFKKKYKKR
jgi:hypothetical protein